MGHVRHPGKLPRYQFSDYSSGAVERTIWWYDAAKAAKIEQAK